jgi:hypothetical protein
MDFGMNLDMVTPAFYNGGSRVEYTRFEVDVGRVGLVCIPLFTTTSFCSYQNTVQLMTAGTVHDVTNLTPPAPPGVSATLVGRMAKARFN